jgi:hypothetical protein
MTTRKTAAQHAVAGTTRPDRQRPRTADAGGIGDAPLHLFEPLTSLWRELAAALPPTVGAVHDRPAFELLVRLVAKSRAGTFTAAEVAHMRGLLESFGMTPSGRHRLDVPSGGSTGPARKASASRFFRP